MDSATEPSATASSVAPMIFMVSLLVSGMEANPALTLPDRTGSVNHLTCLLSADRSKIPVGFAKDHRQPTTDSHAPSALLDRARADLRLRHDALHHLRRLLLAGRPAGGEGEHPPA